jgi:hypothetical protein
MKNIVYILVCASVIFFTACSSQDKNKKDGTQVLMQDSTEIAGPQRMQVSDVKTSFTYKGKEYQSSVVRRPDESLPIVKNEQGEKFVDNRITLRITCGGKQVVDKVFCGFRLQCRRSTGQRCLSACTDAVPTIFWDIFSS